jgi:C4-dicarboxylate-specific signal transduction histidine kinase
LINKHRRGAPAAEALVAHYAAMATENANIGLWFWVSEPDRVWMNPHCRKLLSVAGGAVDLQQFLEHLAGPQAPATKQAIFETVKTMGSFRSEFETRSAQGSSAWIHASAQSIRAGNVPCLTGTLRDITDQKSLQDEAEQLRRQVIHLTRVSTLGELSGAVAHELNQPLTAILSNAQAGQRLINRNQASIDEIYSILGDIIEDDRRAGAVLTRLRNMIRNEHVDFSEIDINDVVAEVLRMVNSELIERRVELTVEQAPVLPTIRGDRIQIQQVLINLVRNACDAMAAERWSQHRLVVRSSLRCDGGVAVTVIDNGIGLPPETRANLFEPFVTTKPKGMGLGLTISRAIISGHRGEIWCEDNPGGGSIFGFALPALERRGTWSAN